MSPSKLSQSGKVRISHSLNEGEKQHVSRRSETVLDGLKRQGIDCSQDSMPKIALLGSGGGERAMLGLLGSLVQLKKCDLLDTMLYLSGISGSTWCMASLYKEPDWSTNLDAVQEKITKRLDESGVSWSEAWTKLNNYYNKKANFSLTDVWAAMYVTTVMKEVDESIISSQRENHSRDPYPIYTVIDKHCKKNKLYKDVWLEVGPHEAGCSLTGAFVDSSSFGSQFKKGILTDKQPEIDLLYLQGLCGSAIADEEETKKWLWNMIKNSFTDETTNRNREAQMYPVSFQQNSPQVQEVLSTLVELNICVLNKEDPTDLIREMNELLKGKVDKEGRAMFITAEEIQHETGNEILKQYTLDICDNVQDWFKDSKTKQHSESLVHLQDIRTSSRVLPSVKNSLMIPKIMKLFSSWTWGTTYNFLHKMEVEDVHPSVLGEEKRSHEDAGLLINSPYFPMLRKERHIDLIISLDFSAGDPMETVVRTSEICSDLKIPFPEVKKPASDTEPEDFYVFEGKNEAPTVIHIPLFNKVNCKGDIKEWEDRYRTFQKAYSHDMIIDLINKAGENVINNKEKLWHQIRSVIEKKKTKTQ